MTKENWDRRLEIEAELDKRIPRGCMLIRIIDAADILGVPIKSLRSDKEFPVKKVGGRYYVGRGDLVRWMCK